MIRFIDLGKQIFIDENATEEEWPRQFAFFNTVNDRFVEFDREQVWSSWKCFEEAWAEDSQRHSYSLERFRSLCPDWVFKDGERDVAN